MVREVDPDEVQSKLASDDEEVTVVDIRSPRQFALGHVPGAINVPLPELPRRVDAYDWDADEVVAVCPHGESSIQAARLLGSYEGIHADAVASLAGGYREWDGDLETGAPASETAAPAAEADGGTNDEGPEARDEGPEARDEGPEAPF
ncbi:rhodanese-related sulfurtransferase [Salinarchaeum sp. Harcht-Bsk1]|uniref:rhodanese-like domain-containing protein n=1 Tax=Salinarchaeum sp. Harcht-Bsk1 TaxID=1333523 RepID=UPI0003422C66|nr:rhodanese-like domain-containing protein [Salinarchaeum sp. Harcht-Bsk1]AGN00641.1 rhodanese-related sulfurtransferase [Salinarchaeum sp. Harcht-Bsk1]